MGCPLRFYSIWYMYSKGITPLHPLPVTSRSPTGVARGGSSSVGADRHRWPVHGSHKRYRDQYVPPRAVAASDSETVVDSVELAWRVARAASAQQRSLRGRRKPKVASRVESAQLAAAAGAQAIASWLTSGTVHGGPPCNDIPAFAITIDAVARRPADAARKRVRAAAGRRIERGQQADDNDCWQVERLLDARQRPKRAGKRQSSAIDALLLWAGTWGGAQDWTPVNKAWIPDANLRRQAHAMWATRKRQAAGLPSCDGSSDGGAGSDEHSDSDVQQVPASSLKGAVASSLYGGTNAREHASRSMLVRVWVLCTHVSARELPMPHRRTDGHTRRET
jgi:hypothetical protein